eukprot:GDKH01026684.1.p3 GENE.GDKH01026684.1~~GDKH01026684.1.p3  ORF type:complete len:65 (+),score=0.09 GDKH01026684.1:209-403(+)
MPGDGRWQLRGRVLRSSPADVDRRVEGVPAPLEVRCDPVTREIGVVRPMYLRISPTLFFLTLFF